MPFENHITSSFLADFKEMSEFILIFLFLTPLRSNFISHFRRLFFFFLSLSLFFVIVHPRHFLSSGCGFCFSNLFKNRQLIIFQVDEMLKMCYTPLHSSEQFSFHKYGFKSLWQMHFILLLCRNHLKCLPNTRHVLSLSLLLSTQSIGATKVLRAFRRAFQTI